MNVFMNIQVLISMELQELYLNQEVVVQVQLPNNLLKWYFTKDTTKIYSKT